MSLKSNIYFCSFIIFLAFILTGCKNKNPELSSISPTSKLTSPTKLSSPDLPYKAKFAIYTNNTFRVFTAAKYHNRSPDAYIQAVSPNTVIVTKVGITWGDFFKTIHLNINKECLTTGTGETFCNNQNSQLKFYLNDKIQKNLLEMEISPNDKILITYGDEAEEVINSQLQKINSL